MFLLFLISLKLSKSFLQEVAFPVAFAENNHILLIYSCNSSHLLDSMETMGTLLIIIFLGPNSLDLRVLIHRLFLLFLTHWSNELFRSLKELAFSAALIGNIKSAFAIAPSAAESHLVYSPKNLSGSDCMSGFESLLLLMFIISTLQYLKCWQYLNFLLPWWTSIMSCSWLSVTLNSFHDISQGQPACLSLKIFWCLNFLIHRRFSRFEGFCLPYCIMPCWIVSPELVFCWSQRF